MAKGRCGTIARQSGEKDKMRFAKQIFVRNRVKHELYVNGTDTVGGKVRHECPPNAKIGKVTTREGYEPVTTVHVGSQAIEQHGEMTINFYGELGRDREVKVQNG